MSKKIKENKQQKFKREINFDKTRIAISGFSSGGNIALNLALSIYPPQVETSLALSVDGRLPLQYPSASLSSVP